MRVLNKIVRIYQQTENRGRVGYPLIDEDMLEDTIYELSEFIQDHLDGKLKITFIEKYKEKPLAKKEGIEYLKAVVSALEQAMHCKKSIYRKMVFFDEAKHWLHKAIFFEGDLGKIHKVLKRGHRHGWTNDLLT